MQELADLSAVIERLHAIRERHGFLPIYAAFRSTLGGAPYRVTRARVVTWKEPNKGLQVGQKIILLS